MTDTRELQPAEKKPRKVDPTKAVPTRTRHFKVDVSEDLIKMVVKSNPGKSPQQFLHSVLSRLGYAPDHFKKLEARVARYRRTEEGKRRVPSHIRDKMIVVDTVNRSVEAAFAKA